MSTITDRIAELRAATPDISVKKLRAYLAIDDFSNKDISIALKEAGISVARKSFKAEFNTWLIEKARTEAEAKAFIDEFGSDNDRNQESARLAIWKLAQDIRASLAVVVEEK